ncbi:MAG: cupredoxin domain-containing protein [Armatimonadetes bacterium]|nr:cupredoxin domain-containing protein [Armatimonadota bacterium]
MHAVGIGGVLLILLLVLGAGALGGWGMHGPWTGWGPWGRGGMGGPMHGPGPAGPWGTGTTPGSTSSPVAGAPTVTADAVDFGFRPVEIRVAAGQAVNLALANRGAILHDLFIPALGVRAVAGPGQQGLAGLRADVPGTYEFYCSVPGHREAGMVGRLVVMPRS